MGDSLKAATIGVSQAGKPPLVLPQNTRTFNSHSPRSAEEDEPPPHHVQLPPALGTRHKSGSVCTPQLFGDLLPAINIRRVGLIPNHLRLAISTWETSVDIVVHLNKLRVQVLSFHSLDAFVTGLTDCAPVLVHKWWSSSAGLHFGGVFCLSTSFVPLLFSTPTFPKT